MEGNITKGADRSIKDTAPAPVLEKMTWNGKNIKPQLRRTQSSVDDIEKNIREYSGWEDKITVTEYENPEFVRSRFPMTFEPMPSSELGLLRSSFDLGSVVEGASSDIDYFLKLSSFIKSQYPCGSPIEKNPPWHAFYLLTKGREGNSYYCTYASIMFVQCLIALGGHARFVNVRYPHYADKLSKLHHTTEAWSDEWGKWVLVETNACVMFTTKDSPVPLSALDLHNIYLSGNYKDIVCHQVKWKGYENEPVHHHGSEEKARSYLEYFSRFNINMSNDICSRAQKLGRPLYGADMVHSSRVEWFDEKTPKRELYNSTNDPNDLYPTVNRVHIDLTPEPDSDVIEAFFSDCIPNLDRFEVKIDDNPWVTVEKNAPSFLWKLKEGNNLLKVRGVSTMQVATPISSVGLLKK